MENTIPKHPKWCDPARCTVSADHTNGSHASRPVTVIDADQPLTLRLVRPDQRNDAARQVLEPGYRPARLVIEPAEGSVVRTVPVTVWQAHLIGRILRTPVAA
ncbi:hypothetical protein [Micromonospora sp. NPDC005413]|uniref:hypothetical protein n=1 Tax=Micromonospora sp. NPDC005413 TaxID=3154563 RepID=UPI0033B0EC33